MDNDCSMTADSELVAQFQNGNADAFRILVERYTPSLYNLALRLVRDPMEAENITQETFLRLLGALPRVRLDAPFRPYLFRITVNLCRDAARKRHATLFADLGREDDTGDDVIETIADDAPEPWEQLVEQELHARVREVVENLPLHYQSVLQLRYVEEFSYDEIAETLGLPLNTVRTHLRRAKRMVRAKLEGK
jgi:RNA polymerase sigma-70 factor, ECF subfamily